MAVLFLFCSCNYFHLGSVNYELGTTIRLKWIAIVTFARYQEAGARRKGAILLIIARTAQTYRSSFAIGV
jgi:hypothetical protein